ncbi:MAG: hypothetical protein VYB08_19445 [Candidatus Latescibacterota bacterium]|nr:hypothetical protein [Candidatus Latescibacterota bacterium]
MRRLALIVTLAVILHPIHAEATDLQTVKERTVDLLSGGRSDGAHRSRAQADLDDRVQRIVEADREPLTWEDPAVGGNLRLDRHLAKVRTLAEGWASAGRHHGDEGVLNRATIDLANALDHYHADSPRPGAWYYWLIPISDKLGAIGLLLGDALDPAVRARLEASLTHQLKLMRLSGANAAWEARNHAYLALLQGDSQRLARAADCIFGTVRYSSDGGVREDFSYLFHVATCATTPWVGMNSAKLSK